MLGQATHSVPIGRVPGPYVAFVPPHASQAGPPKPGLHTVKGASSMAQQQQGRTAGQAARTHERRYYCLVVPTALSVSS
jgi:hypothetical protein